MNFIFLFFVEFLSVNEGILTALSMHICSFYPVLMYFTYFAYFITVEPILFLNRSESHACRLLGFVCTVIKDVFTYLYFSVSSSKKDDFVIIVLTDFTRMYVFERSSSYSSDDCNP